MMCNTLKRCGIFVVYDRKGIIDDYCVYILKELKTVCSNVAVICNGEITKNSMRILEKEADLVFVRENKGYDALAYKFGLEQLIGWTSVADYDEVILANDSFYGPFWPLADILMSMEDKEVDFWGITAQEPMLNIFGSVYPHKWLPYHIQTYFIVIRSRLLYAPEFREFWDMLDIGKGGFTEAVSGFELAFTSYFQQQGFLPATYVDSSFQRDETIEKRIPYILYEPCELIEKYHCPIMKRKCFTIPYQDIMQYSLGQDMSHILEIIQDISRYDTNMIWKHLIRTMEPGLLHQTMHLRFVLPARQSKRAEREQNDHRAAIIAHINYPELQKDCILYLQQVPLNIDIFVTTKSMDIKKEVEARLSADGNRNVQVIMIGDRGREIRGMLVECAAVFAEYEYICYVHDKRTAGNVPDRKIGERFFHTLWSNMLKSSEYINNVLEFMEMNRHIGLLAPPEPYHWNYFRYLGQEWTANYDATYRLADKLNLQCIILEEYPPFVLGTTFWCRSDALKPLFDYGFREKDFEEEPLDLDGTINHAIERIFQYVAQSQGYASGILVNDEFASDYLQDYHSMINGVLTEYRRTDSCSMLKECMEMGDKDELIDFCNLYGKIYIYGTGNYGLRMTEMLADIGIDHEGYIVSDGYRKDVKWKGKPVYELSEVMPENDSIGILLAVDRKNQSEVLPMLKEKGMNNIYNIY